MMIIALGTVIEWFQNYYKNGFRTITRTVSGLLQERFQDYYKYSFRIITRTVSDYYENGFRLLQDQF